MWDAWPDLRDMLLTGLVAVPIYLAVVGATTFLLRNRR